jgi:acyl-coenzyme A synthetase/AMP-(fatty) acid ligase
MIDHDTSAKCDLGLDLPLILVILPNVPEYWFILLASLRLGTVFSPSTVQLTSRDIAYRIHQARPRLIVTNPENVKKVNEAEKLLKSGNNDEFVKLVVHTGSDFDLCLCAGWQYFSKLASNVEEEEILEFKNVDRSGNSLAYIFFTSGTTGQPKMVAHSHASYGIGNYTTTRYRKYIIIFTISYTRKLTKVKPLHLRNLRLRRSDIHYQVSDPGWVSTLFGTFGSWNIGACVFVHEAKIH